MNIYIICMFQAKWKMLFEEQAPVEKPEGEVASSSPEGQEATFDRERVGEAEHLPDPFVPSSYSLLQRA
jgi:hypothetical protein